MIFKIHENTRTQIFLFAEANIKYIILCTAYFEKNVKTLNIDHLSLTFITTQYFPINTVPVTAHKEKNYPFFFTHILKKNKKNYLRTNDLQIIHFSIQPTLPLTFKTLKNEIIFSSTSHQLFRTRFNSSF